MRAATFSFVMITILIAGCGKKKGSIQSNSNSNESGINSHAKSFIGLLEACRQNDSGKFLSTWHTQALNSPEFKQAMNRTSFLEIAEEMNNIFGDWNAYDFTFSTKKGSPILDLQTMDLEVFFKGKKTAAFDFVSLAKENDNWKIVSFSRSVPETKEALPFYKDELAAKRMIESLGGEIGERDTEGRITIVVLDGEKVDDTTIKPLENLKKLTILELRNTKITRNGYDSIRKALPKCHITFGPADAPKKSKRK